MALWVCVSCSTAYAVGLEACPQCGSTDSYEEGQEPMPKISVHGGPTSRHDVPADAPAPAAAKAPAVEAPPAGEAPAVVDPEAPVAAPAKRAARKS